MCLTLEALVIAHSYALALICAGNAAQSLTAGTCISVAARACLPPLRSSPEVMET